MDWRTGKTASVLRLAAAALAGVVAWFVFATIVNLAFRAAWPGYARAEPVWGFDTGMLAGRLLLGAASSVFAGMVGARIAQRRDHGAFAVSALLLVLFVPQHVQLWARFPLWYHATFLVSLLLAPWLGARLVRERGEDVARTFPTGAGPAMRRL